MNNRKGKLEDSLQVREKILQIVRNKEFCYGVNEYGYLTFVTFEKNNQNEEWQWWVVSNMKTYTIRNCGANRSTSEYRYWSASNGLNIHDINQAHIIFHHQLTMFQNFNAMRLYMTNYFKNTQDADIGLLLSDLMLSSDTIDWREKPRTWDPPAWYDWMDGVHKTLQDLHIAIQDPLKYKYNEQMAFLCMKNYLNLFYKEIKFEGVKNILQIINNVQVGDEKDSEWIYFLKCIQSAIDQEPNIIA